MTFTCQILRNVADAEPESLGTHVFEHVPKVGESIMVLGSDHRTTYFRVDDVQHWPLPEQMPETEFATMQRRRAFTMVYVK